MIWQSPGLAGWRKVNFITVTRRPHHPNITAGLDCLATSPGFLPTLCEKWSGFFYVHRVFLSYTRDRRLKVSSERLGNEDKAPCPRALLPDQGSNRGPPVWKSEALTARPRQPCQGLTRSPPVANFSFPNRFTFYSVKATCIKITGIKLSIFQLRLQVQVQFIMAKNWWQCEDSISDPLDPQTSALPNTPRTRRWKQWCFDGIKRNDCMSWIFISCAIRTFQTLFERLRP